MKVIRWILGLFILSFEKVYNPKGVQRSFSDQAIVNTETRKLTLYQYKACPFCLKVRLSMKRLSLNVIKKDAKRSDTAREELLAGGGLLKVPCLRIIEDDGTQTWLYESSEIISFLESRFAASANVELQS
jgi:glutaredoxin